MKILPAGTKIANYIEKVKYNRDQKFINNFVKIDENIDPEPFNQLYSARKTLANYACNKGIDVSISEAENSLKISVTNLLRGIQKTKKVSSDVNSKTIHTVHNYFVIDDPSEGLQFVRKTKHEYEDNFLRTIYRTIENTVNELFPKK